MSDGARYRQKARDFEQRENWKRAIEAYELAIEADHLQSRDTDLALYNRIGDLYRRVGNVHKAVEYYEMAVDGHLSAGFYNNAIALCNKILRNQPNRHSAYLKLGKIGAAKGFLSDARRHFLEYAERMQKSGGLDQAFSALIEFASLSPDPEVRMMIADQLIEHDRNDMAVDQLRLAWRDMSDAGRDSDAAQVRERILEMAPDRDPEVDPPEASTSSGLDAEGILDLPELLPYDEEPRPRPRVEDEPESEPIPGFEAEDQSEELVADLDSLEIDSSGVDTFEPEEVDVEGIDIDALEVDVYEPEADQGPGLDIVPTDIALEGGGVEPVVETPVDQDGLEIVPTTLESEEAPEEEPEEEPVAVLEPDEPADEPDAEGVELETSVDGWGEIEAAAVSPEEAPAPAVEEVEETPADRVAELEARLGAEGRTPELLVELAEAVLEVGETDVATAHLEEALAGYEAQNRLNRAGRVLDELIRLNVNDMRAYQKRVEFALRSDDRGALIEAYLGLADCLDRTDAGNKARVVYSRVLELDPENQRAVAALEMFVEEPAAKPAQGAGAAASSDEYVDLGSLVAEPEPEAKSTRFIVPSGDPQSETDVNFSEMLDQFKSKVAEAIEKEDASSHYDLGLAFKDMGLLNEAIAEFQIAARAHEYRLRAIEMLGDCFMDKGDHRIALKVLSRALQVSGYTDDELIGIFYLTGRAFESLGEDGAALEWYERVLGCDMHFRDASQRVSSLRA